MKLAELPEQVEPLVILGDDNNYLTVYTCMSNEDTIELLRRSLQVLEMEQEQADINLHLH
jgi:hypothetical protein